MSLLPVVVQRPRPLPELGSRDPIDIDPAPAKPDGERGWLSAILPGLSGLGILGFALLSPSALIIAVSGGLAVVGVLIAGWVGRRQARRRRQAWASNRERYRGHLAGRRRGLAEAALRQQAYAWAVHPPPSSAIADAEAGLVWDRRADHPDFLQVRVGVGRTTALRAPRRHDVGGSAAGNPDLVAEAADVTARFGAVDEMPMTLDLTSGSGGRVTVFAGTGLPLVRAFIVSLVRGHGPDVVRLHALAGPAEQRWLKLLPHTRCATADPDEMLRAVRAARRDPDARHQLAVVLSQTADAARAVAALAATLEREAEAGIAIVVAADQPPVLPGGALVVSADGAEGELMIVEVGRPPRRFSAAVPDTMSYGSALHFAELLSRCVRPPTTSGPAVSTLQLSSLLTPPAHPLVVPLGRDEDGATVTVDLREAARGGDGPHGLVIGATGSGKSELLRTILVAAAAQSPPQQLAFLLVDFKGGAAFSALARLPHTAGLLTNLGADPREVDRLSASLRAELRERQQRLAAAGVDDIDSYRASDASDASDASGGAAPLPRLLVVVDEYAELIEQSPDMLDVLTSLGRLGRSLGMHLLLSSQRVDDGRLRGLDAHLRFRICLRTFAAAESVAAIGSPAAAQLPPTPGAAWLRKDDRLVRFRTALVGDPVAVVEGLVSRLPRALPAKAAVICLPPLPTAVSLASLPKPPGAPGKAVAAVGVCDLPEARRQPPLVLDLTGPAGHLAVVGAPRSGRSTALATAVAALALATAPRDLAVHVVTAASSVLTGVAGLPHVGTVATTPELAERVIRAVFETVRQRRIADPCPQGRVLLVVDDFVTWNADDALTAPLAAIAAEGLAVGVSLAVSCGRWSELRGGLREAMGARWELRLHDSSESLQPQHVRRLPQRPEGRMLTETGQWAQLALPRIDGVDSTDGMAEALAELVAAVARRGGPATRPVQLLPRQVSARSLPRPSAPGRVPLGVHGTYAEPFEVPLSAGDHLLVLGNSGSGRSGLLRAIADSAHAWDAVVWAVDPRRSIAGHAQRRASTAAEAAALAAELAADLTAGAIDAGASRSRRPPASRLLLIDDLELVEGRRGRSPLDPIVELLPHAAELGLSVVVSRRASGYGRAAFEPFFGQLLDLCDTGIVLSADPAEGAVIGGVRPRPLPPGRGELVLRGQPTGEVQVAWLDDGPVGADSPNSPGTGSRLARLSDPGGHLERPGPS